MVEKDLDMLLSRLSMDEIDRFRKALRRLVKRVRRASRSVRRHVRRTAKRASRHAKRVYHHARKAVRKVKKGLKFLDDKLKMTKVAKGLLKVFKNGVTIGRLTLKRSWLARLLVNLLKQKVEAEKKKAVGLIQKAVRDLEKKLVQTVATQIGSLLEVHPVAGQPFRWLKTHKEKVSKVNTAFKAICGMLGHNKSLEDHLQILFRKIINKKLLRQIPLHDEKIPIIGRTVAEEIEYLRERIITALLKRYGLGDSQRDKMIMKVALFFKTLLFNPKDMVKTLGKLDLDPNELLAAVSNTAVGALEDALTRLVVAKLDTLIHAIPTVGQYILVVQKSAPIIRQVNSQLQAICGLVGFQKTLEDRIQELAALLINQKTLQYIPFHDQWIPIVGCTISEQIENMRVKIVAAWLGRYGLCDGKFKERKRIQSKPKMSKDFKKIGNAFQFLGRKKRRSRRRRDRFLS